MSRRRFDRSQVRPNIRTNIEERDRLQQTLTELSVKAMGADRFGEAKNEAQITDVIQELYHVQSLQEGLESPTSAGNTDLKSIARTKQLLEERALEFNQKLQDCLLSFGSSQKEALPHLKRIQTLYRASNTAANESLDQKTQALQVAAKQSRTARFTTRDAALGEFKKLEASVYELIGQTEGLDIEIIGATESTTPGRHLRISGNFNEQTALKNALIATGLSVEEKSRGATPILVVRLSEPLKPGILRELKENFKREMATAIPTQPPISPAKMRTAKASRRVGFKDLDRPNIRVYIEERDSLQQILTELSVKAMGVDRFGEAKNEAQITDVIQELYHVQSLQQGLESPTSAGNTDLKSIARTKQLLEERALEFNQKLQDCLLSFGSSQKEAFPHLKRIQALYRASNTAANESLDQKIQALQVADKQSKTARVKAPERADLNARKVDINAEYRKDLQRIVAGFNMPPEFTAEINAGTESTPGEHLRFSAHPKAHYGLAALKAALDETGISYEEKAKGTERMLIIRQMPHKKPGFEAQLKQHYVAALKKIDSEAKATKAATQILKDIQVSQDRLSMLARELQSRNKLDLDSMTLTSRDEVEYFTEETLDELDVEKDNIIQLKERLEAELPLSNMPVDEQKVLLQHTQNRVEAIVISAANMRFLIDTARDKRAIRDSTPLPSSDRIFTKSGAGPRIDYLKRQGASEAESDASTAEKIELLAEIKRIKGDIHNMVENLTNEIPKTSFSKDLKTQKRNTLLSLSRTLYVSEKSSLTELRECADKFRGELAKCKTDAVLRQGNMRKTCRTLIDDLSKDVESEQHVFKRPR